MHADGDGLRLGEAAARSPDGADGDGLAGQLKRRELGRRDQVMQVAPENFVAGLPLDVHALRHLRVGVVANLGAGLPKVFEALRETVVEAFGVEDWVLGAARDLHGALGEEILEIGPETGLLEMRGRA